MHERSCLQWAPIGLILIFSKKFERIILNLFFQHFIEKKFLLRFDVGLLPVIHLFVNFSVILIFTLTQTPHYFVFEGCFWKLQRLLTKFSTMVCLSMQKHVVFKATFWYSEQNTKKKNLKSVKWGQCSVIEFPEKHLSSKSFPAEAKSTS